VDDERREIIHAARNALNGLTLQLEVAALQAGKGELEALRRSIDAARGAAGSLAEQLDALDGEVSD